LGLSGTRLAPHRPFIPLGQDGKDFDSHTCFSAPGIVGALSSNTSSTLTRFYYEGGDGPHNGGPGDSGMGRKDAIGLATATTDALAGLTAATTEQPAAVWTAAVDAPVDARRMWVLASGGAGAVVTVAVASRADGTDDAAAAGRVALADAAAEPRKYEVQWPGGSLAVALSGEGRPAFRFLVSPGATVFAFGFWP